MPDDVSQVYKNRQRRLTKALQESAVTILLPPGTVLSSSSSSSSSVVVSVTGNRRERCHRQHGCYWSPAAPTTGQTALLQHHTSHLCVFDACLLIHWDSCLGNTSSSWGQYSNTYSQQCLHLVSTDVKITPDTRPHTQ